MRYGLELATLGLPFKAALPKAAELGVEGVEIDVRHDLPAAGVTQTGLRQIRKLLDDHRLRVAAVTFQTRRGYDVLEGLDRRVEATKQAMDFAYKLGCSVVVNSIGRVPEDRESQEWSCLLQALADLGRFGQQCGAMVAARTGSEDAAQLGDLIDKLPPASLAVNFDPGAIIQNGFRVGDFLSRIGGDIVHVHARDGVRDLARGRGIEVPVGEGSVDFAQILAELDQQGYRGFWTISRDPAQTTWQQLRDHVEFLRNLAHT